MSYRPNAERFINAKHQRGETNIALKGKRFELKKM
jgi:hypothetical protein